jgi:hypothetical protein
MENSDKSITLASFVYLDKVESFKKYILKRFGIEIEKIFHYNCDDENKTILTYRVYLKEHEKIDLKSFFPTTIIVHKKGECFYTINALNLLIESLSDIASGNINYKDYKIDWDNYQNKMILSNRGNLKIMGIQRDFSE